MLSAAYSWELRLPGALAPGPPLPLSHPYAVDFQGPREESEGWVRLYPVIVPRPCCSATAAPGEHPDPHTRISASTEVCAVCSDFSLFG